MTCRATRDPAAPPRPEPAAAPAAPLALVPRPAPPHPAIRDTETGAAADRPGGKR